MAAISGAAIKAAAKKLIKSKAKSAAKNLANKAGTDNDGNSSTLKGVAMIISCVVFISAVLVSAAPSVVWNGIFHTNEGIDPLEAVETELVKNNTTMESREEELAELVLSALGDIHDSVYTQIEANCKKNGIDYDLSVSNVIESLDYLSETENPSSKSYNMEQAVYSALKAKGYNAYSAVALTTIAKDMTSCKPTYEKAKSFSLDKLIISDYGVFALDKDDYSKWLGKNIESKKDLKAEMKLTKNQVAYVNVYLNKTLGSKTLKKLKKTKNLEKCIKGYMKAFPNLETDYKTLRTKADTYTSRHQINLGSDEDAEKTQDEKLAESTVKNEIQSILSDVKARKGYPTSLESHKSSALSQYKKHKKEVDSWYKFLTSEGFSPAAAAGVLGNAYRESGWRSDAEQSGGGARGMFQWDGGRRDALYSYAKKQGKSWKDVSVQQGYFKSEFKGAYAGGYSCATYAPTPFYNVTTLKDGASFKTCNDPVRTFMSFMAKWERPSFECGKLSANKGYAATEVVLEQCAGLTAPDYTYAGAGTRQMALILSAFSAKEGQFFEKDYSSDWSYSNKSHAANAGAQGALAWAEKIVKENESKQCYYYKRWSSDKKTHQCPICHKGTGNGWQCIGFCTAAYYHGANIKTIKCGMAGLGTGGDGKTKGGTLDKSTDEALLNTWNKRTGGGWQLITNGGARSGKRISENKLEPGDVLICYNASGISYHLALYAGNGKVYHSTSGYKGKAGSKYNGPQEGKYEKLRATRAMRYVGSGSSGGDGTSFSEKITVGEKIARVAETLSWPEGTPKSQYHGDNRTARSWNALGTAKPTEEFQKAMDRWYPKHFKGKPYQGHNGCIYGACCCHSTKTIVSEAMGRSMPNSLSNPHAFEKFGFNVTEYKRSKGDTGKSIKNQLQRGDVLTVPGHTFTYLGEGSKGKSIIAEGGLTSCNFNHTHQSNLVNYFNSKLKRGTVYVIRYADPNKLVDSNGYVGSGGFTLDESSMQYALLKAIKENAAALFKLNFGDIETDEKTGKKYYTSIEIMPATAEQIIKEVFGMDPLSNYVNGGRKTTLLDATTTMADSHMELLYGNHDIGKGTGEGSMFCMAGSIGNPLGSKPITRDIVTSWFGPRNAPTAGASSYHNGYDLSWGGCHGAKLYAAISGKVVVAGTCGGYGNCVQIQSGNMTVIYGHLSKVGVSKGQTVQAGAYIGNLGNTGVSTGAHLHFEIRVNGKPVDPGQYLGIKNGKNY